MDRMETKNKGLKMKNKFVSAITFGLTLMPFIFITACDTKECDPKNASVSPRAKDGEHGAHGCQNIDGQNGQNGILGQDGGNGGNGGNSEWGQGGNGGNGGDVD